MAFGRSHHALFQPLVKAAFKASGCRLSDIDRDVWYRAELRRATGKDSSKDCSPVGDFLKAMAHFERLAGKGTLWKEKLGEFLGHVSRQ